jgi:hypothetical protein
MTIVNHPVMPPAVRDRIIEEQRDLRKHQLRLSAFLISAEFAALRPATQQRLRDQEHVMRLYYGILTSRLMLD